MKRIMRLPIIGFFALLLALSNASCKNGSEENELFLFKHLEKGVYTVGYKSFWKTDYSRLFIFENDTIYRPLLVNIWYPSIEENNKEQMTYMDYFQIQSENENFKAISTKYKEYNLSTLAYELIGKKRGDFNKNEQSLFEKFLDKRIFVQKNPEPLRGSFPLVIYHQGNAASFDDNTVLAQFLASHGYVVIGSSFFKENGNSLGVDGRNESIKDIHYLTNYASEQSNVDITNISLIGHSAGAQASVLAKSNNSNNIKSVVGIETTQETYGISDTRWNSFTKPVIENIKNVNGSLLAFTDHKAVFQLYDLMSSADRTYITFPSSLDHNEYISQGIFSNYMKYELSSKENRDSNWVTNMQEDLLNYVKVNNYILKHLDWKLKGSESYEEIFQETHYNLSTDFSNPIITHVTRNTLGTKQYIFDPKIPLTPRQVWKMARSNDSDQLTYYLNHFHVTHAGGPIYNDLFAFALISELVEEDDLETAKELLNFYNNKEIPITQRFVSLSRFSLLMRREDYAKKCLLNLLKIDPDNVEAKKELKKLNET